jgi:hypothetical protein
MTSFVLDIKAFEEQALLMANKSVCNAFEEIATGAVVESPDPPGIGGFSKGLLKNSWYPEVGGIDNTVGTVANPTGADSLSRIKAVTSIFPFYGKDNFVTLTNSVEHAYRSEFIGWPAGEGANGFVWSGRVGPYAMVQTAITNYRAKHI